MIWLPLIITNILFLALIENFIDCPIDQLVIFPQYMGKGDTVELYSKFSDTIIDRHP